MLSFIKTHKIVSGLIAINILAIIIVIVVIILHNAKTATIDIRVAPADAVVTLNGRRYDNLQSHDVLPGNYHVKIAKDNMQIKEYDITLEKTGFARIWEYLLDANGGLDYYLDHSEDEAILVEIAEDDDKTVKTLVDKYEKITSIQKILPFSYDAYTDDFSEYTQYNIHQDFRDDCKRAICLIIEDNTGGNEQTAKNKLKELGYDLENYDIVYQYKPLYTSGMDYEQNN